jgi:sigma-54 dependent transcriptional regulator, acetoin dehydrogenase operon transcriptional activator AcoR
LRPVITEAGSFPSGVLFRIGANCSAQGVFMPARTNRSQPSAVAKPRLAAGPFFSTAGQRVALARQRYFNEGVRPSGLVSESVIQSWARCLGQRREPGEHIAFDPVTKARVATTQARNRQLLDAAAQDLSQLTAALVGTACRAILTSLDGVLVYATPAAPGEGRLMPIVTRVGVNLGESAVGTAAPGLAACTGEVCVVHGAEHFFSGLSAMYCAAAPIRDARGNIAAVLDLSSEGEMFRFDAASMVSLYATGIENRLLEAQSREHVLLRFQASPALLRTPLEGLAAVAGSGRVVWINASGASLLGCERAMGADAHCESLLGVNVESLLALAHEGRTQIHRVTSGLSLWMQAQLPNGVAARQVAVSAAPALAASPPPALSAAVAAPPPRGALPAQTLEDTSRALIERTIAECHGNLSSAARRLGVSRGLLYRRLRAGSPFADTVPIDVAVSVDAPHPPPCR